MLCSMAGSVYDTLTYVHPVTLGHNGMLFSTFDNDNDVLITINCAGVLGGGWWFSKCSIWCPTTTNPTWLNRADAGWYTMENVHMMIKLQ